MPIHTRHCIATQPWHKISVPLELCKLNTSSIPFTVKVLHSSNVRNRDLHYCKHLGSLFNLLSRPFRLVARFSSSTTLAEVAPALFHSIYHELLELGFIVFLLAAFSPPVSNCFFRYVLCAEPVKTTGRRGSFFGQLVYFLVEVSGEAVFAGIATLNNGSIPGETFSRRKLRIHKLSSSEWLNQASIGSLKVHEQLRTTFHPYLFNTSDDVPESLHDFHACGFYVKFPRALRAVSISVDLESAFSAGAHTFVMSNGESTAENVS